MAAHTDQEFKTFISQLRETNQTLDFFCDFEKISKNVDDIKLRPEAEGCSLSRSPLLKNGTCESDIG